VVLHPQQTELFAPTSSPAVQALNEIDADNLTPKQALELIYYLKDLAK
jgi:DNA mismatch repair protein MutS